VRAVLAAADIPGENRVGVILDDQPLLAHDKVRYRGETLALIAADSEEQAAAAARLVKAELAPLPAVFTIEDVDLRTEHPIHADGPIAVHQRVRKGDTARGFAEAAAIVQGSFRTGAQEHYYFEPQGCVAAPDGRGGLVIHGSLQCPFYVQKAVARTAGLPLARVRVIQTPTGGAFGGKEDLPSEMAAKAALLALATGRPVRLLLERREDIAITSKRHPFIIHGRLGATAEGRFTAIEIFQDADAGAYATLSPPVLFRSAMQGAGPYAIPNVHIEARGWYTNNVPSGAFRGFGGPQACFAHESLVDMMAAELGMDPVQLRRLNMLREGGTTATGHRLEASVGALDTLECVAAAVAASDATTAAAVSEQAIAAPGESTTAAPGDDPARWIAATGYACMIYGNCLGKAGWYMDGAGAHLQVHADGSVSLAVGLTEMGQGAETALTQFAAEALGVTPASVTLLPVDTAMVPDSGPTVASRNVVMSGNAILDAAGKLRARLAGLAGELLGCAPETVDFANGRVRGAQGGARGELTFAELAAEAWRRNLDLAATGWWHVPALDFDAQKGAGEAYFAYSFATHAARVAVDRLTGQVRLLKVWAAHDVGRAVNPAGIEAQVEGGVAQGMGWALTERFASAEGAILSDSLSRYSLPSSLETPAVETIIVEAPHPQGPLGAKSLGEPAIIPTAAAIANAVSRALGRRVDALPIDPEIVLQLLEESRA
jgi:CO/xanthine dehydrogenase Mo-binding subunit